MSGTTVNYPQVSFYTKSYDTNAYRTFLRDLRNALKSGSESHGIPVLRTNLPIVSDKRFVLVLIDNGQVTATIGLDAVNANVVGFSFGQSSYFFHDVSAEIFKSPLFSGTKKGKLPYGGNKKGKLPYGGIYQALSGQGADRKNVALGITAMDAAPSKLLDYVADPSHTDIAPDLLVLIEMISEAARFKYIEDKLVASFTELIVKPDIISREDKWGDLSFAIQKSANASFDPIALQDEQGRTVYVSTVREVQPQMGLLKST